MLSRRIVADHVGGMLFLEIRHSAESYVVPEFLTIGTMRSFNLAVLRGLPRIDEIVDETVSFARDVKRMQAWRQRIGALPVSRVVVGEDASVVRLDALNMEWCFEEKLLKEYHGRTIGVFPRDPGESPPACAINGGELVEPISIEFPRIDGVDLHELAGKCRFGDWLLILLRPLLSPHHSFACEHFVDRPPLHIDAISFLHAEGDPFRSRHRRLGANLADERNHFRRRCFWMGMMRP